MPLVSLQARKTGVRLHLDCAPDLPAVWCDRTMVEQVLLNLARNGLQAMEEAEVPPTERVLHLRVRQTDVRWVTFELIDCGPGIPDAVARQLFTPFFTTKPEGMGIGLAMCRTVVEQHGGALDFGPGLNGRGTAFRFTLPSSLPSSFPSSPNPMDSPP